MTNEYVEGATVGLMGPTGPTGATGAQGPTNWTTVPASATAAGTHGQYSANDGYSYICYADGYWIRTPAGTW